MAERDRARDTSHFPAKFEIVVAGARAVLVERSDGRNLEKKRQGQQPQEESGQRRPRTSQHRA